MGLTLFLLPLLIACSHPDPESLAVLADEARSAFQAKKYEEAAEVWGRLALLDPRDPRPRYNQACALQAAEKNEPARALLAAIDRELSGRLSLGEEQRRLLYQSRFRLGSAAAAKGQAALKNPKAQAAALPLLEESAAWFRRAAELDADEGEAAANLERLRRLIEPLRQKPPEQQQQQQQQQARDKLDQLQQQQQEAAEQNRSGQGQQDEARKQQEQLSKQTQEAQKSAEQAGASPEAREALDKAREAQQRAEKKLQEGRRQEAAEDQKEAAEQLARAREAMGEQGQEGQERPEQEAERPLDREAREALQREKDQQRQRAARARRRSRAAPVEKDW